MLSKCCWGCMDGWRQPAGHDGLVMGLVTQDRVLQVLCGVAGSWREHHPAIVGLRLVGITRVGGHPGMGILQATNIHLLWIRMLLVVELLLVLIGLMIERLLLVLVLRHRETTMVHGLL